MTDDMTAPRVLGRALLMGGLGAVALPLIAFVIGMIGYAASDQCGRPSDSGGCEMGVATATMLAVPLGAVLFFLASLMRSLWRSLGSRQQHRQVLGPLQPTDRHRPGA